jgi:hypothetical protein
MNRLEILEVLPPCVWISSWMLHHPCCLNFLQLLLVKPLSQSFITSSSPPWIICSPQTFGDVDEFDFFFNHKIMETFRHACKTTQVHILPLRRWSGAETNANKPTIPRIFTCGIASLAKENKNLVSVRVCKWRCKWKGRYINNDNVCTKL